MLSPVWLFVTPLTAAHQASLSFTIYWSLLKPMSIELVMPSNDLVLCHPLFLPSIFPASGPFLMSWLFTSGGRSIGAAASILLINIQDWFSLGWFDLLAVQGTLETLLQHHDSKASILRWSAFFMVQLSHPYMTMGKTVALTRWTFDGKVMSLLFNELSRFAIAFLPRRPSVLFSWLWSPSALILESRKIKPVTLSIDTPSICHEVMGPDAMILAFECWVLGQLWWCHLHIWGYWYFSRQSWFFQLVLHPAEHFIWCTLHIS